MNARKPLIILLATILLVLIPIASSGQSIPQTPDLSQHWRVLDFSIAQTPIDPTPFFGGAGQIPLFGYINAANGGRRLAFPALSLFNLCGPSGDLWNCPPWGDPTNRGSSISKVASRSDDAGFIVGWLYQDAANQAPHQGDLMYSSRSYSHDMFTSDTVTGVFLHIGEGEFQNYTLAGRPALAFDSQRKIHAVVPLRNTATQYYELYYVYPSSPGSSCGGVAGYHCDLIYDSTATVGPYPVITLTSADTPRVLYHVKYDELDDALWYAYPVTNHPYANCGPGDTTWRCVLIAQGSGNSYADVVENKIEMAAGPNAPHILYTLTTDSAMIDMRSLMYAEFVHIGGNCGLDWFYNPLLHNWVEDERWKCTSIATLDTYPYSMPLTYSIQVDQNDVPVVAYFYENGADASLAVAYPASRHGGSPEVWEYEEVDTGVVQQVGLALNRAGKGFLVYRYQNDGFRIAFENTFSYLPVLIR